MYFQVQCIKVVYFVRLLLHSFEFGCAWLCLVICNICPAIVILAVMNASNGFSVHRMSCCEHYSIWVCLIIPLCYITKKVNNFSSVCWILEPPESIDPSSLTTISKSSTELPRVTGIKFWNIPELLDFLRVTNQR